MLPDGGVVFAGIQYVLLLKNQHLSTRIRYALYGSTTRPHPTIIPTACEIFHQDATGASANVTFDLRRILSIDEAA